MKLYVRNGEFRPESLFKFAFVGVFLGEALIFGPIFLLVFASLALSPGFPSQVMNVWILPILLPAIFLMHGVMFGGLIVLGLWLYSRRGKLEVIDES